MNNLLAGRLCYALYLCIVHESRPHLRLMIATGQIAKAYRPVTDHCFVKIFLYIMFVYLFIIVSTLVCRVL